MRDRNVTQGTDTRKALVATEAEIAVLGGCLIDPEAILVARKIVTPEMLTAARHRLIYRAMLRAVDAGQAIDPVTISEDLRARGELEDAGGLPYLAELLDAVPTAANLEYHAGIGAARSARRRLESVGRRIAADAADPELTVAEVRSRIGQHAEEVSTLEGVPGLSRVPAPLSMTDLAALSEPEEAWIVQGLLERDSNLLVAGYPKSHKTNFLLELSLAGATATPFLGRFRVPEPIRVGLVLMEDRPHRIRRRLERMCQARGVTLEELEGRLFIWFRPALQLNDAHAMQEIGAFVESLDLDLLLIDNWALVQSRNSNDADEVTPQLDALSRLRDRRDGLTVGLVHHARKTAPSNGEASGDRLTDVIRNSSAFGAWYECGIALIRQDETAPVRVRVEMRDLPSPDPFVFVVDDEFSAGPDYGVQPGGWLRLRATDRPPAVIEREAAAERFREPVLEFLRANPGCSKRQLRDGIQGENPLIEAAFSALIHEGKAWYKQPKKRGQAGQCFATVPDRAATVPGHTSGGTVPTVPATHPLKEGGRTGAPSTTTETPDCTRHGSASGLQLIHESPRPHAVDDVLDDEEVA